MRVAHYRGRGSSLKKREYIAVYLMSFEDLRNSFLFLELQSLNKIKHDGPG